MRCEWEIYIIYRIRTRVLSPVSAPQPPQIHFEPSNSIEKANFFLTISRSVICNYVNIYPSINIRLYLCPKLLCSTSTNNYISSFWYPYCIHAVNYYCFILWDHIHDNTCMCQWSSLLVCCVLCITGQKLYPYFAILQATSLKVTLIDRRCCCLVIAAVSETSHSMPLSFNQTLTEISPFPRQLFASTLFDVGASNVKRMHDIACFVQVRVDSLFMHNKTCYVPYDMHALIRNSMHVACQTKDLARSQPPTSNCTKYLHKRKLNWRLYPWIQAVKLG